MMKDIEMLKHDMGNLRSSMIPHHGKESNNRATTINTGLPRSCFEIKEFDPNFISGEYIIDPDGMHVGSDPITVLCDATTGNLMQFQSLLKLPIKVKKL